MPFSVFSAFRRVDPLRWARTTSSRATPSVALIAFFHKFPLYLPQSLQNERRLCRSNFARCTGRAESPKGTLRIYTAIGSPTVFAPACPQRGRVGAVVCRRSVGTNADTPRFSPPAPPPAFPHLSPSRFFSGNLFGAKKRASRSRCRSLCFHSFRLQIRRALIPLRDGSRRVPQTRQRFRTLSQRADKRKGLLYPCSRVLPVPPFSPFFARSSPRNRVSPLKATEVQILFSAPTLNSLNFFVIKRMFGLFCFIEEFEKFRK